MLINLDRNKLIDISLKEENCVYTKDGAIATLTGANTGRAPNAKRIVKDSLTKDLVDWSSNNEISAKEFEVKHKLFTNYLDSNKHYIQNVYAVRDNRFKLSVKVITEYAVHSLFARNMFVVDDSDLFKQEWEVLQFPSLSKDPQVLMSFSKKVVLISGTLYSGEIKKSIFTALNFKFPTEYNALPMHCSVNVDKNRKNPTIFFGLSGTGKTTLSSDVNRILIGDDEHGWTDDGLTNFESGCYAKTIKLSKKDEPQIWKACHTRGTILENVVVNDGIPDFDDSAYTENSRASYPIEFIDDADLLGCVREHPKNIVMLTCDAFGVLPPVMKLNSKEAVEQFLLGYTAKVAGTEQGTKEPIATFSPCFGAPFMPLSPKKYGELLKDKIEKHKVNCWFVNTGWTGGPYGIGYRIPISITRGIINQIHNGNLSKASTFVHEPTGFTVPIVEHDLIPVEILEPEKGWKWKPLYFKKLKELNDLTLKFINE